MCATALASVSVVVPPSGATGLVLRSAPARLLLLSPVTLTWPAPFGRILRSTFVSEVWPPTVMPGACPVGAEFMMMVLLSNCEPVQIGPGCWASAVPLNSAMASGAQRMRSIIHIPRGLGGVVGPAVPLGDRAARNGAFHGGAASRGDR